MHSSLMARLEVARHLRALQVVVKLEGQEVDDCDRRQEGHLVAWHGGEEALGPSGVFWEVLSQHRHTEPDGWQSNQSSDA